MVSRRLRTRFNKHLTNTHLLWFNWFAVQFQLKKQEITMSNSAVKVKVHHNVAKRAAKLGVSLVPNGGVWTARHVAASACQANTAKDALDMMALALKELPSKARTKSASVPKIPTPKIPKVATKQEVSDQSQPSNKSVVHKSFKDRYAKNGGHSGSNISKALSDALLGEGAGILPKIAHENGIKWVYGSLDTGRQRMCLGTILKGMDRRGEKVVVLGKKVTNA